jgi:hypothetical protein
VRFRAELCISVVISGCMAAGAGAGLAAVPATAAVAAARPAMSVHHVSPFGVGARRAARHVQRPAAAPAPNAATTRWVSNMTALGTAPGTSCADPGYATISAALAAANPGDIIKVCAGTYDEQLAITRGVILQAKGPVTVAGPAAPSNTLTPCDADGGSDPDQTVVDICGPDGTTPNSMQVTISGFTIQGNWPSNVCDNSLYGVTVLGGANLVMSNSTVEGAGGNPQTDGCQGGVGIQVGFATSGTTADIGTATLNNDVVTTYQKNGITVDGNGSGATINNATVTGTGPTPAIAQNGIQISDFATAKINSGSVSGNECNDTSGGCGPDGFNNTQSCGILLFDAGKVSVSGTNSSANDIGVYNIEDFAWDFYTPPSPFVAINDSLSGLRLGNRYENVFPDQGKTTLNNSTLSGGEVGIETDQYSGQTTPAVTVANSDKITGASEDAILIASDHTPGDKAPKLTVAKSSFDTSNTGGIENDSTSVATATNNWWGDASGPSVWNFGAGSSVSADVNFFPWYTNAGMTTLEPCASGASETTTGNDVVLCGPSDGSNAFLANNGSGNVLLIGNTGNDQLVGSGVGGETWIISGLHGTNTINGKGGTGFIQKRGNANDTIVNAANYTKALR